MRIESINPATGELLESFEPFTTAQVDETLTRAREAFRSWRERLLPARADALRQVATVLRARKDGLARIATLEMGKPIVESEAEIEKCAWNCEFYADNAATFLADTPVVTNAAASYVSFLPLGVVLAVMPWNFPYWQVLRFAAPALMAGNTAVLKHASNVTRSALEIERIFQEAGLPDGIFQTLVLPGSDVERVIGDPRVAAVTLTGSDAAGVSVASAAGRALKKTVLELGGSDAFIVLADADLDEAARVATRSRFQNTGQSCIAAKRFIVVDAVYEPFVERFAAEVARLRVGDPLQRDTQVGPMARADLRDALVHQLDASVSSGARVVVGGRPMEGQGAFFEPTVLADVTTEMPAFREETFGPLAAVIRARDTDQAVALANESQFGLGGNLWTQDVQRGRDLARRIESGAVFINGMTASDPRLPFGGVKRSGYGRELSSFGIREFTNIQTVWIGPAAASTPAQAQSDPRATTE